jgi:hypothetical protein
MACARGGNTICLIIGRRQPSIGWAERRYLFDFEMFRKFRSLVTGMGDVMQFGGVFGWLRSGYRSWRFHVGRLGIAAMSRAVFGVALAKSGSFSMDSLARGGLT